MKYLIIVYDGMADNRIPALGNRTPMEAAKKPCMDALAKSSLLGTVCNVPKGMVPESDTANLAILSYDPRLYSKGRSPLEAVSMGLAMKETETAFRCNLVALSEEGAYEDRIMLDHSADEISTEEASHLIAALESALGTEYRHFYTGISYRHCILWENIPDNYPFARPHDIIGQRIGDYLPSGEAGEVYLELMKKSEEILRDHPINVGRRKKGLKAANSAWLWSPGKKPALPSFREKFGLKGSVVSAVDLIKGIGLCAGMEVLQVEGATGNYHTNYEGKAEAAMDAFRRGQDLVYIHVEAPDECGHRAEIENKVSSIERIDERILSPLYRYLMQSGEPFRIMTLPDHPTPVSLRTHTSDPVPFLIYDSEKKQKGADLFTEETAAAQSNFVPDGTRLMELLLAK